MGVADGSGGGKDPQQGQEQEQGEQQQQQQQQQSPSASSSSGSGSGSGSGVGGFFARAAASTWRKVVKPVFNVSDETESAYAGVLTFLAAMLGDVPFSPAALAVGLQAVWRWEQAEHQRQLLHVRAGRAPAHGAGGPRPVLVPRTGLVATPWGLQGVAAAATAAPGTAGAPPPELELDTALLAEVREALLFSRLAAAAYGWKLLDGFRRLRVTHAAGANKLGPARTFARKFRETDDENLKILCAYGRVDPANVVVAKWNSQTAYDTGHFVAVLPEQRTVVVAIRGTFHVRDALTDMCATYSSFTVGTSPPRPDGQPAAPWEIDTSASTAQQQQQSPMDAPIVDGTTTAAAAAADTPAPVVSTTATTTTPGVADGEEPPPAVFPPTAGSDAAAAAAAAAKENGLDDDQGPVTGSVHTGIMEAAMRKREALEATVRATLDANPGFRLVVTGHSLGAGTAALLSMIWAGADPDYFVTQKRMHCHAYACPPVMSAELASRPLVKRLITTYVVNDDIIPRLSFGSMASIKRWLVHLEADDTGVMQRSFQLLSRGNALGNSATDYLTKKFDWTTDSDTPVEVAFEKVEPQDRLVLAGRVFFIYEDDATATKREAIQAFKVAKARGDAAAAAKLAHVAAEAEAERQHRPPAAAAAAAAGSEGGGAPAAGGDGAQASSAAADAAAEQQRAAAEEPLICYYDAMELSSPAMFPDIILSPTCITDHFPDLYDEAIERILRKIEAGHGIPLEESPLPHTDDLLLTSDGADGDEAEGAAAAAGAAGAATT